MEKTIILVNFNTYLGGGETLLVRYANYLQNKNIPFKVLCLKESYIYKDLLIKNINTTSIHAFNFNANYYYLKQNQRKELLETIFRSINTQNKLHFVTFCLRDLYTILGFSSKNKKMAITHLILHIQDDLYVGQTLFDKLKYKVTKKIEFSQKKVIQFNRTVLKNINNNNGLISMAELISNYWNKNFGIKIDQNNVVPLPSFVEPSDDLLLSNSKNNSKKILWIGRIVDFKIPSLVEMINFINDNKSYSLTIVGKGDKDFLLTYIKNNKKDSTRIHFLDEVNYNELSTIISNHGIGYAMGTSLIELAKYKLPVIIALANYNHNLYSKQICGGLFYDKSKGCDGSDLMIRKESEITDFIPEIIYEIEKNYDQIAQKCYDFAKNEYNEETNFKRYTQIILNTKPIDFNTNKLKIPQASLLRKILFKYHTND